MPTTGRGATTRWRRVLQFNTHTFFVKTHRALQQLGKVGVKEKAIFKKTREKESNLMLYLTVNTPYKNYIYICIVFFKAQFVAVNSIFKRILVFVKAQPFSPGRPTHGHRPSVLSLPRGLLAPNQTILIYVTTRRTFLSQSRPIR